MRVLIICGSNTKDIYSASVSSLIDELTNFTNVESNIFILKRNYPHYNFEYIKELIEKCDLFIVLSKNSDEINSFLEKLSYSLLPHKQTVSFENKICSINCTHKDFSNQFRCLLPIGFKNIYYFKTELFTSCSQFEKSECASIAGKRFYNCIYKTDYQKKPFILRFINEYFYFKKHKVFSKLINKYNQKSCTQLLLSIVNYLFLF